MPSRILREGINSSARVNALSPGAEILYRRLMSVADDYGRFHAAPQTVLGACWPTTPDKVCPQDVSKWLTECQQGDRPLLTVYEVDGAKYLQITDFNQKKRSKSRFPEPVRNLSASCPQNASTRRNAEAQCASYDAEAGSTPSAQPRYEPLDEAPGPSLVEATLDNLREQYDVAGFLIGDIATARAKLEQILGCAVNPDAVAGNIKRSLAAHIVHWRLAGKGKGLRFWLQDEEYLSTPAPPRAAARAGPKNANDERMARVIAKLEAEGR